MDVDGVTTPPSFETYVATRSNRLVGLAYLMVRDQHLAEDLAQEALARLHRHYPRVRDSGNPDAYVRKIMLNQLLSWRRRRAWSERTVADPEPGGHASDPATATADRDEMWSLLGTLPPRQRAVLVLRFYEDLDDAAIAGVLECSPATVRAHASKALARLRDRLTDPAASFQETR
jgi:RNA polymerase sigma-70 factor (sigma-E family)